ncbi:hypothetical protein G7046_g5499 [Stylonectria norvegica]|nr:hypothetical protein G7046_g5499 [Stylonectria norvegica]
MAPAPMGDATVRDLRWRPNRREALEQSTGAVNWRSCAGDGGGLGAARGAARGGNERHRPGAQQDIGCTTNDGPIHHQRPHPSTIIRHPSKPARARQRSDRPVDKGTWPHHQRFQPRSAGGHTAPTTTALLLAWGVPRVPRLAQLPTAGCEWWYFQVAEGGGAVVDASRQDRLVVIIAQTVFRPSPGAEAGSGTRVSATATVNSLYSLKGTGGVALLHLTSTQGWGQGRLPASRHGSGIWSLHRVAGWQPSEWPRSREVPQYLETEPGSKGHRVALLGGHGSSSGCGETGCCWQELVRRTETVGPLLIGFGSLAPALSLTSYHLLPDEGSNVNLTSTSTSTSAITIGITIIIIISSTTTKQSIAACSWIQVSRDTAKGSKIRQLPHLLVLVRRQSQTLHTKTPGRRRFLHQYQHQRQHHGCASCIHMWEGCGTSSSRRVSEEPFLHPRRSQNPHGRMEATGSHGPCQSPLKRIITRRSVRPSDLTVLKGVYPTGARPPSTSHNSTTRSLVDSGDSQYPFKHSGSSNPSRRKPQWDDGPDTGLDSPDSDLAPASPSVKPARQDAGDSAISGSPLNFLDRANESDLPMPRTVWSVYMYQSTVHYLAQAVYTTARGDHCLLFDQNIFKGKEKNWSQQIKTFGGILRISNTKMIQSDSPPRPPEITLGPPGEPWRASTVQSGTSQDDVQLLVVVLWAENAERNASNSTIQCVSLSTLDFVQRLRSVARMSPLLVQSISRFTAARLWLALVKSTHTRLAIAPASAPTTICGALISLNGELCRRGEDIRQCLEYGLKKDIIGALSNQYVPDPRQLSSAHHYSGRVITNNKENVLGCESQRSPTRLQYKWEVVRTWYEVVISTSTS